MEEIQIIDLKDYINELASVAKREASTLASLSSEQKNAALLAIADLLESDAGVILEANALDILMARVSGMGDGKIDRLKLTEERINQMAQGLREVAKLPDPIGEVLESWVRDDGLRIEKVRVPMGVIAMIYESRPNVTIDAAALTIKTGNSSVLRGGKEAIHSNQALVATVRKGLLQSGLPEAAVQLVERVERESVDILIKARGLIDLVIPRGGAGLISHVTHNAYVPVMETGIGNCHVYVDEFADSKKAIDIVINAKVQRPSVCNAAETLLVHEAKAESWLAPIVKELQQQRVEVRVCEKGQEILRRQGFDIASPGTSGYGQVCAATESDYATEFLDYILAVKVVSSLEEGIEHIQNYGTRHSEAIVTEDANRADQFLHNVDAAAVYHNASTRFTDGFEFGFGAEIGISTQKLHARGPMGLREITSYKYLIRGDGHIRK